MSLLIAPLEALTDSELTDPERRVLLALFSFRGKDTNTVWPSVTVIAERANINDHTRVSKLTTTLAAKGWLTKKKRGFTGGNEYVLTVPERLSNLDSDANLEDKPKMDGDTKPNLDSDANSNLDSDAKCKEEYIEQTSEQEKYMVDFESLWKAYPKREGSNPKNKALECYRARLREGVAHDEIARGLFRYIQFCAAKGQIGTSFVMQAKRFFGTSKEFENSWEIHHATSQRPNQPSSAVGRVAAGNAERSRQREEALARQGSVIDDTGIVVVPPD